eukprot:9500734-Pyramimonas_sp.AAC.1
MSGQMCRRVCPFTVIAKFVSEEISALRSWSYIIHIGHLKHGIDDSRHAADVSSVLRPPAALNPRTYKLAVPFELHPHAV